MGKEIVIDEDRLKELMALATVALMLRVLADVVKKIAEESKNGNKIEDRRKSD